MRWRYISGHDKRYKIAEDGTVKSLPRRMWNGKVFWVSQERILTPSLMKIGYWSIALTKDKRTRPYYLHRLLAEAFIPNPKKKTQINHKDANKQNCVLSNLEWMTPKENNRHARLLGLYPKTESKGIKNPAAKIDEEKVRRIRKLKGIKTLDQIAAMMHLNKHHVWKIQHYKLWTHIN